MNRLLTIIFLFGSIFTFAQSTAELEKQLKEASGSKEKMSINYQLAEAYFTSNVDKSIEYAKRAHNLANDNNNDGMAARSAYLVARGYGRKRKQERNQEVWLKSALKFAKQAGDSDLIIKSVQGRARLASKDRNYRKAFQIVDEAFKFFSTKGKSISELENNYDVQRAALQREKRALEREREELQDEIQTLNAERDQLTKDKSYLARRTQDLEQQKEQVEQEVSSKEEQLVSIEEEKKRIEIANRQKEKQIKLLTKEALMDSLNLANAKFNVQKAEMKAERASVLRNYLVIGAGFLVVVALLFYSRMVSSRRKNKLIQSERERSDELLLNILPAPIADELKVNGKAKAQRYEQVTVLFSDFKNFTKISEQLSPEELVEELDKCFKAFDFIMSQYPTIEKIKTIGDAYMAASGLEDRKTIPNDIIRAALEMQEFLDDHKQENIRLGKPFFEARIGIHTGPVVAGVVGVKKFGYDIWGDTVNIASRMEANSEVGRVNISESTYNLVRYRFDCEYRGKIQAKNKGAIDMYFVRKELSAVPA